MADDNDLDVLDATPEDVSAEGQPEPEPSRIEVPLEGDHVVKVGDWEGPASNFRKHWLPQTAVQEMREKDKQRFRQELEQAKKQLASQQEQFRQYQQQQTGQQQQQGGQGSPNALQQLFETARKQHGGYIHADHMNQIADMFQKELATRDQVLTALAQRLDSWYGDYTEKIGSLDKLTGSQAEQEWNKFVDGLSEEFTELPRSTVERIATAYNASEDEYGDDLREGIRNDLRTHIDEIKRHQAQSRKKEQERQNKAKAAGIAGVGGRGAPSKPGKPLRSAEEITDKYYNAGGRPA